MAYCGFRTPVNRRTPNPPREYFLVAKGSRQKDGLLLLELRAGVMNSLLCSSVRRGTTRISPCNIGLYISPSTSCYFGRVNGVQHRLFSTLPPPNDGSDLMSGIPILSRPTTLAMEKTNMQIQKEPLEQLNTLEELEEREQAVLASVDESLSKIPGATEEEITEEQIDAEHKEEVRRMWEPYVTDDFSPQKLLGDIAETNKDQSQQNQKESRPSAYYIYTDKEIKTNLPEGLSGRLPKTEHAKFDKKALLVRPIVEDVITWMNGWREKHFIGRYRPKDYHVILDGPRGCGKSSLLNPIAHYARMEGWLVIFIPDGLKWTGTDDLAQSRIDRILYDQLSLARSWCAMMLNIHGDKFKKLPLRTTFSIGGEEGSAEFHSSPDKTLYDLLSWPQKHDRESADAVWHFRRELCTVHEYPIAIIADGVNAFHCPSSYSDPLDPYIFSPNLPAKRLTLTKSFCEFEHHGLINGLYIGATTSSVSRKYDIKKQFPSANVVQVPPYSKDEVHQVMEYYKSNGHFAENIPTQTVDYLWAMTSGNPLELWRQAGPL